MAPEADRGAVSTAATDQFAFGIVCHEILTGRRPVARSSEERGTSGSAAAVTIAAPRGEIQRALWAVIARCLAAEPTGRFPDSAALVSAIADARGSASEGLAGRRPARRAVLVTGALALWGVPGLLPPMTLQTNAVEYINHDSELYQSTKQLEKNLGGLSVTNVWLSGPQGSISSPATLRGLADFQTALQNDPSIGSATSLVTILRTLRYLSGKSDQLPTDDEALEKITDDIETLLPREAMLQSFVDKTNLGQTHFAVLTSTQDYEGFAGAAVGRVGDAPSRAGCL
jgi:hypothetical protein